MGNERTVVDPAWVPPLGSHGLGQKGPGARGNGIVPLRFWGRSIAPNIPRF